MVPFSIIQLFEDSELGILWPKALQSSVPAWFQLESAAAKTFGKSLC